MLAPLARSPLRRYAAVTRISVQLAFVARGWLGLRVAGGLIVFIMPYYVWETVYAARMQVSGLDWAQMKMYLLLGATFTIILEDRGAVADRITKGDIVVDFARPLRMWGAWLAESLGKAIIEIATVVALWIAAAVTRGGLPLPRSAVGWMLFVFSLLMAMLVKFSITHAWALLAFWTYGTYGLERLRIALSLILSGGLVPIAMLPGVLRYLAEVLPFQDIVNVPATIATVHENFAHSAALILLQIGWAAGLWAAGNWMASRGLQHMAIQGG